MTCQVPCDILSQAEIIKPWLLKPKPKIPICILHLRHPLVDVKTNEQNFETALSCGINSIYSFDTFVQSDVHVNSEHQPAFILQWSHYRCVVMLCSLLQECIKGSVQPNYKK